MRVEFRKAIQRALNDAFGPEKMEFHTGFAYYMGKGGFTLPCMWICPLELTSKKGREDGEKIYSGTMYMLESIEGLSPAGKDEAWDRMESEAIAVLEAAAEREDSDIVEIENIKCLPDEYALSGFNSISTTVTFDVTIQYCGNRE